MIALLDTGFLYALFDSDDVHHNDARKVLEFPGLEPVLPDTVLVELAYLLQARLGHSRMRAIMRELAHDPPFLISLMPEDLTRIETILTDYADVRLDFVDASIVAMAERLDIRHILTVDRRDFQIIRPRHCAHFDIFP